MLKRSRLRLLSLLCPILLPVCALPAQTGSTASAPKPSNPPAVGRIERTQTPPPQTDETAAKIVDLVVQALGGQEAFASLKSLKVVTDFVEPTQEYTITTFAQADGRYREERYRYHLGWEHLQVQVTDGQFGWARELKPEAKPGDYVVGPELRKLQQKADFRGPFGDYRDKGYVFRYMGTSEIAGRPVYLLDVTLPDGSQPRYFIDSERFLPVAVRQADEFAGVKQEAMFFYKRYKRYEGVLLPVEIEARIDGQPYRTATVSSVSVNADFPNSFFHVPRQALLRSANRPAPVETEAPSGDIQGVYLRRAN
ncbi:MAG: hypothetical protein Q7P63_11115 [Verrucomicrobiota bacterium JB022]|nr:hypothetical protein [Verrucomicrobiota bacterium JB022]